MEKEFSLGHHFPNGNSGEAQGLAEQYFACLGDPTGASLEQINTCAKQADPNYTTPAELDELIREAEQGE